ncbi:DUF5018 domain-containing protein [Larkinella sp. GY13]|uniref:DUF5018 domain-containing protein n=1 Tax=Larkinella sp. GY13 TaxID=3453720 RepID=UPI003EEE0ED5
MSQTKKLLRLFIFLLALVSSCKKEEIFSDQKVLLTFSFTKPANPTLPADITGTISGSQVTILLPVGANVNGLKATFSSSPLSTVTVGGVRQETGVTANDFTSPVTYRITAEDGSTAEYKVTVTVAKSPEKQILSFSLSGLSPAVQATIEQSSRKITATVPARTTVTALVPTIGISPKATVNPASGAAQNFTNPVNYTVVAEDGSSQVYEVTINVRQVSSVPAELNLNSFYKKYLDASGIPIVSSEKVPDAALVQARNIINQMVEKIPNVVAKMIQNKTRLAIMAESEVTTDIPEHSDLYTAFPGTDWNTRARGLGATIQRPATSCAEENLLCYPTDRYLGEDILVHEFAHTIHIMGIAYVDVTFDKELESIFKEAIAKGLWNNTYATTNFYEYWAEGVQCWYDLNKEAIPSNGIHNEINTREELRTYDPKLYELISRYFLVPTKKVSCHAGK